MAAPTLKRTAFTKSRELEFFSEGELVTQTGYDRDYWWPEVLAKELIDNSLDAVESAGITPGIKITFTGDELVIADNGPGIPADVVSRILDFTSRTSDKAAYVSPTRGAQGNAFKTLLAIPYVLGNGVPSTTIVEAQGLRHTIVLAVDHVAQCPEIEHRQETQIVKTDGTTVRLKLPSASSNDRSGNVRNLRKLVSRYALFNPHATFTLDCDGAVSSFPATKGSDWKKWIPSDPTPACWYNGERFEDLVASYVAAESPDGPHKTVREVVSEFRGCRGTAKQKEIVNAAGLDRTHLHQLIVDRRLDRKRLGRLLDLMTEASRPVDAKKLGILGEDHFAAHLKSALSGTSFRYKMLTDTTAGNLPFVVEAAFIVGGKQSGLTVGLNWSVPLSNPLDDTSLSWRLANEKINLDAQFLSVALVLHLICPRFAWTDRGKGSIAMDDAMEQAVIKAALTVTKDWSKIQKRREKDAKSAEIAEAKFLKAETKTTRVSAKDAAAEVIPAAYAKAAGSLGMALARQIMYAARGPIQEKTGEILRDDYFTQTLLPDYIREHPEETKGWNVLYDSRGHLTEPHGGNRIGLGTKEVREYLKQPGTALYGAILYVEKEGFDEIFKAAKLAERYDLAIMSTKGMGTVAARTLIEGLAPKVKILVMHDFDQTGLNILGILTRNTRRYEYTKTPKVIDLGLRLADVKKWKLQPEEFIHRKGDPEQNLIDNGATSKEIDFLRGTRFRDGFKGQRVELNSLTNDQLIKWLEEKLQKHGVTKLVPTQGSTILAATYRGELETLRYTDLTEEFMKQARLDALSYASTQKIPEDLHQRIKESVKRFPEFHWHKLVLGQAAVDYHKQKGKKA